MRLPYVDQALRDLAELPEKDLRTAMEEVTGLFKLYASCPKNKIGSVTVSGLGVSE